MVGTFGAFFARNSFHRLSSRAQQWEADTMKRPLLIFPEEDLMHNLIDIFFSNVPNYLTAIHEPSFRREVACGLHHLNSSFGGVVLMVCGVASRVSRDNRVLLDGASEHSAGWKWVSQTLDLHTSLFQSANLYDIQYCCVSSFSIFCGPFPLIPQPT